MVLFNFVSIKAGGGLQNTLSFLDNLQYQQLEFTYIVACVENSVVHQYCCANNIKVFLIGNSVLDRFLFEILGFFKIKRKYDIKVIFTIFGAAPLLSYNAYKITGCAYSNIFQPEIDIWGYLKFPQKQIKKIIDFYRVFSLKMSNEVILETNFLKEKAILGVLKDRKVSVIEMSPSKLVTDKLSFIKPINLDKEIYNILYLSGPQPNKRIDKFLDILFYLNENSKKKYILKLTLPEESTYYKNILIPKIYDLKLESYVINLGTILPQNINSVINNSDAIANVALIESFSNNWVEAWASSRLLISTDADWSKASCKDAALYVDILEPKRSASLIKMVFDNHFLFNKYINSGCELLKEMPTSEERTLKYLSLINSKL